jgi:nucleoside-diphosphate-sugar epimerase
MKVLITGSSGQIGTNLGLRCLARGDHVVGIDHRENTWSKEIPTQLLDLRTEFSAQQFFQQGAPDVVIHLAAHAKVHELVIHPSRALENIAITANVLEYCRVHNVPIIFSSSREVYGDVFRETTSEDDADYTQVTSTYTASKLSSEALIYSYHQCYDLPYIVFRLSNVYGRYDNDLQRMERVIPLFIDRIERDQPITVFGHKKVLDFTYIDDCVDGILRGIDRLHDGRITTAVMNLAYGRGHSLITLAELIGETLGKAPIMDIKKSQVGEINHYIANLSRARELLDFVPKTPLFEGIKQMITDKKIQALNLKRA